jgi:hypothetical protein
LGFPGAAAGLPVLVLVVVVELAIDAVPYNPTHPLLAL